MLPFGIGVRNGTQSFNFTWESMKSFGIGIRNKNQGIHFAWWRHQMETFHVLLAICAGN